jgi:ferredoxin
MCEFCTKHGEGKKWYLAMKNYSEALLHEELTGEVKKHAGASTRLEWNYNFYKSFTQPATAEAEPVEAAEEAAETPEADAPELDEAEALEIRKAVHFGQVLPIEDLERVIDMVDSITRLPCGCRYITTGKTDKRYCFGVGIDQTGLLGDFPDASLSLEVLGKDETKRILREFDREGLIHTIWTGVTPFVIGFCNCDHDCLAYRYAIEQDGAPTFFRGEYICRVDWDLCNGCKACMAQCQFGAMFYSSSLSRVYINPAKCYGCGVCRAACPTDAVELIPREEEPAAANLWLKGAYG